jgi:hypothetical protein
LNERDNVRRTLNGIAASPAVQKRWRAEPIFDTCALMTVKPALPTNQRRLTRYHGGSETITTVSRPQAIRSQLAPLNYTKIGSR